jgi:stage III sporulation protein SpoIIIAA
MIRDISRKLSESKRVIIIDSSCEISGFSGDHYSIGDSRVMQVPPDEKQEDIMIQAIENHTPEVLIVDEIGNAMEVSSIKNCSQRGVILYASAHGSLKNLVKNPILKDLMGGITFVAVSDSTLQKGESKMQQFMQVILKY